MQILFERIGYTFRDEGLARLALTHKSHSNERPREAPEHNERLEFLGDAILDLLISEMLMKRFPAQSEGELSKMRAALVSEPALAGIAREIGLGSHLRMGRGELHTGGADKDSILSDTLEALIAAVYQDGGGLAGGLTGAEALVTRLFSGRLEEIPGEAERRDFKTTLQEHIQKQHKETVTYQILNTEGPEHDKHFTVGVFFQAAELARGEGRSRKVAEQAAAQNALRALGQLPGEAAR